MVHIFGNRFQQYEQLRQTAINVQVVLVGLLEPCSLCSGLRPKIRMRLPSCTNEYANLRWLLLSCVAPLHNV